MQCAWRDLSRAEMSEGATACELWRGAETAREGQETGEGEGEGYINCTGRRVLGKHDDDPD